MEAGFETKETQDPLTWRPRLGIVIRSLNRTPATNTMTLTEVISLVHHLEGSLTLVHGRRKGSVKRCGKQRYAFLFSIGCKCCQASGWAQGKPVKSQFKIWSTSDGSTWEVRLTKFPCGHIPWQISQRDGCCRYSLTCPIYARLEAHEQVNLIISSHYDTVCHIAKALLKHGTLSPQDFDWLGKWANGRSSKKKKKQIQDHTTRFEDWIASLDGVKKVFLLRPEPSAAEEQDEEVEVCPPTELRYGRCKVIGFVWVAPWAREAFELGQYIQLDASFRAVHPYVFCVPQIIIANLAIPIGISVGPSEKAELYENFFKELDTLKVRKTRDETGIPVLSDHGGGLVSFCNARTLSQFFCFRHLIESFGSASALGGIVNELLYLPTQEMFNKVLEQTKRNVAFLFEQATITQPQFTQFQEFLGNGDFKHGLWRRCASGISTCSNHIESFHHSVNQETRGNLSLVSRLHRLHGCVNRKFVAYGKGKRRQLFQIIHKGVRDIEKEKVIGCEHCTNPGCVAWKEIYKNRFGVDTFPCCHEATLAYLENLRGLPEVAADINNETVQVEFWESTATEKRVPWDFSKARGNPAAGPPLDTKLEWGSCDEEERHFVRSLARVACRMRRRQIEFDEILAAISLEYRAWNSADPPKESTESPEERLIAKRAQFHQKWIVWGGSKDPL
jgi:hypothetical protein